MKQTGTNQPTTNKYKEVREREKITKTWKKGVLGIGVIWGFRRNDYEWVCPEVVEALKGRMGLNRLGKFVQRAREKRNQ